MKKRIHIHDVMQSEVVVLGADETPQIIEKIDSISSYIEKTPSPVLRDIALTAGLEARDSIAKAAIVATSANDLLEKLQLLRRRIESGKVTSFFQRGIYIGTEQCPAPGRTVFLFPGEGSQYPDMLRDLSLHFPACRSAFDDADTASAIAGATIAPSQWIFPTGDAPEHGIAESMGMAAAVQSVIAANTGIMRVLTQLGITPDAVAGAGIGELVALECAGAIKYATRDDRLAALSRGHKLLSSIGASGAALPQCVNFSITGLSLPKLEDVMNEFGESTVMTRDQATDLFCVCVRLEAADDFEKKLTAEGAAVRRMPIAKPFHTKWIEPVIPALTSFFAEITNSQPDIPVYSFMNASPIEGNPQEWAEQCARQWANPMRIRDTIEQLYEDNYRVFVEVGARGTLSTMVASVLRHKPHLALASNSSHRDDILQLNHTLAALVAHGAPLDIEALHALRGSQCVDFLHPGPTHFQRVQHSVSIGTRFPSFAKLALPQGLVADAPDREIRDSISALEETATDGLSSYPLLGDAEIIRYSPEQHIDILKTISFFDHPFLIDKSLCPSGTSKTDKRLHGLNVFPIEIALELLSEAARKLYPNRVVTAVENLETYGWPLLIGGVCAVRILAKHLPKNPAQPERVLAEIFESASFSGETPIKIADAVVFVEERFPAKPETRPLALRTPERLDWQGTDIYPDRLNSGPSFQNLQEVSMRGDNGLHASIVVLPRTKLIPAVPNPHFTTDPFLVSAIGTSLTAWHSLKPAAGNLQFASSCDRIEFFSPSLPEWTKCELNLFVDQTPEKSKSVSCDAEIFDSERGLIIRATGWKNRVISITPEFHYFILHPEDGFFTSEIQRGVMPTLPQEAVCCIAPVLTTKNLDEDFDIKLKLVASTMLSVSEYIKWVELGGKTARKIEWLFGRVAAKDAVRRCLLSRYSRKWTPADIRIESDEQGKPSPQGEWRRLCGAPMDISITHTEDKIIAAAAPNSNVGIDIENRTRSLSEEFINAAFSPIEQEIAAESGDGATTLLRFWCAKEALSKALGSGLRYGAGDLCAHSIDITTGRIEMEASRLWLQSFPQLKGKLIEVQSCIIGNSVLAVCMLPR